nr:hypothetical protein CFP56_73302 [Quercus suber]
MHRRLFAQQDQMDMHTIFVRGTSARQLATLQLANQRRFNSLLATLHPSAVDDASSATLHRRRFILCLFGDASSFCSWRRLIDDTSSAMLHPLSVWRRFIGDASSSIRSATLLAMLQFATLRLPPNW